MCLEDREQGMVLRHHGLWRIALVLTASNLASCQGRLPVTPLEDVYHLQVATTRTSYVAGDSVFVRITNHDAIPYVWHRCPGILLQRRTSSGWTELTSSEACTVGNFTVPGGDELLIVFVMPSPAPSGQYRVQVRLSVIDATTPLFWWVSNEFAVIGS